MAAAADLGCFILPGMYGLGLLSLDDFSLLLLGSNDPPWTKLDVLCNDGSSNDLTNVA